MNDTKYVVLAKIRCFPYSKVRSSPVFSFFFFFFALLDTWVIATNFLYRKCTTLHKIIKYQNYQLDSLYLRCIEEFLLIISVNYMTTKKAVIILSFLKFYSLTRISLFPLVFKGELKLTHSRLETHQTLLVVCPQSLSQ